MPGSGDCRSCRVVLSDKMIFSAQVSRCLYTKQLNIFLLWIHVGTDSHCFGEKESECIPKQREAQNWRERRFKSQKQKWRLPSHCLCASSCASGRSMIASAPSSKARIPRISPIKCKARREWCSRGIGLRAPFFLHHYFLHSIIDSRHFDWFYFCQSRLLNLYRHLMHCECLRRFPLLQIVGRVQRHL